MILDIILAILTALISVFAFIGCLAFSRWAFEPNKLKMERLLKEWSYLMTGDEIYFPEDRGIIQNFINLTDENGNFKGQIVILSTKRNLKEEIQSIKLKETNND